MAEKTEKEQWKNDPGRYSCCGARKIRGMHICDELLNEE
nr:MAG TPA: hypothetical protein [Bacteriophage sp.]